MWLKICGGALLCAIAVLLIKNAGGIAIPLQWTGTIVFVGASLLMLSPVFTWIQELCAKTNMVDICTLLLKGLGVVTLTQLCADMCRQSGESSLAGGVELAGKAELLLLCLPYMERLTETAIQLLELGQ